MKKWLSDGGKQKLIEGVERELEADRDAAVASPMPDPETDKAHQGVYCDDSCHHDPSQYGAGHSEVARDAVPRPETKKPRCI